MQRSLVRFLAILMLTGQILPVVLPLLCEQSDLAMPSTCEHQIPAQTSGPAVDLAAPATPCGNPAFCASMTTAVVALSPAVSSSVGESHIVDFAVMTFAPAEPQPPLPPPPQA